MIKVIVNSIAIGFVPLIFPKKGFSINFFTIYNMDEPALHYDYVTLPPSVINVINYCYLLSTKNAKSSVKLINYNYNL